VQYKKNKNKNKNCNTITTLPWLPNSWNNIGNSTRYERILGCAVWHIEIMTLNHFDEIRIFEIKLYMGNGTFWLNLTLKSIPGNFGIFIDG